RSPLFPYTTRFRSVGCLENAEVAVLEERAQALALEGRIGGMADGKLHLELLRIRKGWLAGVASGNRSIARMRARPRPALLPLPIESLQILPPGFPCQALSSSRSISCPSAP